MSGAAAIPGRRDVDEVLALVEAEAPAPSAEAVGGELVSPLAPLVAHAR